MDDTTRAEAERQRLLELQQRQEREDYFRARELHLVKLMREDVAKVMAIIEHRARS